MLQFSAGGAEADRITDTMLLNLAGQQRQDGCWHEGFIARPPMEDGDKSRTAVALQRAHTVRGARPGKKNSRDECSAPRRGSRRPSPSPRKSSTCNCSVSHGPMQASEPARRAWKRFSLAA
ncbi:MAG: hypothetical protein WDO73_12675 [Ignavibacteriota bacterium]